MMLCGMPHQWFEAEGLWLSGDSVQVSILHECRHPNVVRLPINVVLYSQPSPHCTDQSALTRDVQVTRMSKEDMTSFAMISK